MPVRLNSPIWDKAKRADRYAQAIYAVGKEAVKDVAENQDRSVPAGKTYRRGAIARKATQRNAVKGLRMTKGGKRIVGYKLHRASAYGQPPAKDTKTLYRGTKVKRISAFAVRIFNATPYAVHLEPPAKLNRPFMRKPIEANRAKYAGIVTRSLLK